MPVSTEFWTAAPGNGVEESQTDVQALIRQARAGNAAAFERIVILHERRVFRVAAAMLRNREDAGDATQEVFLKLHRGLASFRPGNDFLPWLYRIAMNVCRDIQRKRRSAPASPRAPQDLPESAASGPDPYEKVLFNERRAILLDALDRLPRKERAALVLRDIEGLSAAEAGAALGSSASSVRSQASRARAKVRTFVRKRLKPS